MTVKPGPLPLPSGAVAAPHIDVSLLARGMLNRVVTRFYFADEERGQRCRPGAAARPGRSARNADRAAGRDGYRIDIRLQGEGETVFFAV